MVIRLTAHGVRALFFKTFLRKIKTESQHFHMGDSYQAGISKDLRSYQDPNIKNH
jgi:hypothetical protein